MTQVVDRQRWLSGLPSASQRPWWQRMLRSPLFWITLVLVPFFVYNLVDAFAVAGYRHTVFRNTIPVADVLAGITNPSKNGSEGQSSDTSDDTIAIVDVRNGKEYMGDIPDNSPDSGVIRHGHIPSAINICWENSVLVNARFRSVSDLKAAFAPALKAEKVFVYCYQGHQAAHAWFVLKYLLGHNNVVNYDGSWAEWGNMIRMPVRKGSDPDNVEMSLSWTGTHML